MMLITILLMIEDQRDISCANNACYVHISFLICDENACKTNSVIYFNGYIDNVARTLIFVMFVTVGLITLR